MKISELEIELDLLIQKRNQLDWSNDRSLINSKIRSIRLSIARKKGSHTFNEWRDLVFSFQFKCVRCCIQCCHKTITKDHIIPIYQGGTDSINNLQPLCKKCNSSKSAENFNWVKYRIEKGFNNG